MFDAMDTTGLDTLKATRTLEAAGFETPQAEALVSVFGGPVAGNAATKGDMRDLRSELKTEIKDLRTELKTEIADSRTELKADIAGLRDETNAEFAKLRAELGAESAERRADVSRLSGEISEVGGDVQKLKAQMYRLLLVQATVIIGLIVGLQQLLQ